MPYSVLGVDDEASVRQLMRLVIDTDDRFTLHGTAHDGRDALGQIENQCPDAIVCDLRMPGMDGWEALPHLRAACPDAVIVIYSSDPAAPSALTLGADRVLDKAVDFGDVLDVVAEMLRNTDQGHDRDPA
jgi:CheY-like chemotaxis protein